MKIRFIHILLVLGVVLCILPGEMVYAQKNKVNPNGYNKFYYPNGQVSSEGMMRNGKPDGYWITYYVTGIKKSEGKRVNYMLDSTWIFYNQTGDTIETIEYKYGKKNGYDIKYGYISKGEGITGYVRSRELYVNDKKEGEAYFYYPSGKIKKIVPYRNGKREGTGKEFDEEGNIITINEYHKDNLVERSRINRYNKKGNKEGKWITFYPDGKKYIEENYKDGLLDGYYKEYDQVGNLKVVLFYKDGKLVDLSAKNDSISTPVDIRNKYDDNGNLIESGAYRNGVPIGIHRKYDKNGKIVHAWIYDNTGKVTAEGIITEKGEKEGMWKFYYENGAVRAEGKYLHNQRTGPWKFYGRDGKLEQTGTYRRGKAEGTWRWYFDNSALRREEEFFNGKEDGHYVEYDREGNVIAEGNYIEGEKDGMWKISVGDQIQEGKYIVGLRDGIWKYYYPNGKLMYEGRFVQGLPEGKHKLYYPNGAIREERYYTHGLRERTWKKYDKDGNLLISITYKDDVEKRINGVKVNLQKEVKTIR